MNTQVFRIYCKTLFYQHVKVVGNKPELGNWNPTYGLQLLTNESMYPLWYTDYPLELPAYSKLEFKVVIIDDQNILWECCLNREMNVQSLKQIVIVNYNNPSIQVLGIKSLVSEVELPQIEQNNARKVSIELQDYMSYTDSDSDEQNSKNHNQLTVIHYFHPQVHSIVVYLLIKIWNTIKQKWIDIKFISYEYSYQKQVNINNIKAIFNQLYREQL